MSRGLSQRRSCTLLKVSRSALGYRAVKAKKNAAVLSRVAELGVKYPRLGYRRIGIFRDREGHAMSWAAAIVCGGTPACRCGVGGPAGGLPSGDRGATRRQW